MVTLGFMIYIQQQISSFSTGVSVKMIQKPWFRHNWAPCHPPSQAHTHIHTSPHPGPTNKTERHTFSYRLTKPPSDGPSTSLYQFPTKTPPKSPSWITFQISNKNPEHIAELGYILNFQQEPGTHSRAGVHPDFLTIHPSISPSPGLPENFWGNPHIIPRVPLRSIFQPQAHLDHRARVRLEISNQKTHYIAQLWSSSEFSQETYMARPEHIPIYHSSKLPSCSPSHTPFSKSIPTHRLLHTHLTTHINLPPSLLPLSPPLLHITHGLYQTTLDGHTSHTVLVFKAVSCSRFHS